MQFLLFLLLLLPLSAEELLLKTRFEQAKQGDYIVIAQGKNDTLFHIKNKTPSHITLEEITIPSVKACAFVSTWKEWVESGAPQNTSWILYKLNTEKGEIERYYSVTKQSYFTIAEGDSFLHTLLHLSFYPIPNDQRKKVGLEPRPKQPDKRKFWQPKMIYEGKEIPGVPFDAYYTRWPEDGGPLSGKLIEIYLPVESSKYPAYFPYWLQVRGIIGPGKVRVIDSGQNLRSPADL